MASHDLPHLPSPHPGFGPLCEQCGTARGAMHHIHICQPFRHRPQLWTDDWVDVNAFGLAQNTAKGWPEVRSGPITQVLHGGLGPEQIGATSGQWVRHPDPAVPTHRRVAALSVLLAAGENRRRAVEKVLRANGARIDAWCAPRVIAIRTTGCGTDHYLRIERGLPPRRDHGRSTPNDRGEVLWRFDTRATCADVLRRWHGAEVGTVQLDLTPDAKHRYRRIEHDPGVNAAFDVFLAAIAARARVQLLEAGEPDRWLSLIARPAPLDAPATLHASTRPLAMALINAPPTWLWSDEPLR